MLKDKKIGEKEIQLLRLIKKSRLSKKITQAELAKKTGLAQSFIAHLENLERIPSSDTVKKISDALRDKSILEFYKSDYCSASGRSYDKIIVVDSLPADKESLEKYMSVQKITMNLPNRTKEILNKNKQKDFYAFRMNDESMEPVIKKDGYLIVQYLNIDLLKIYDYEQLDESIIAVCGGKDDKERHIRKLNIDKKNKTCYLQAINPDFNTFLVERNDTYKKFKTDRITKGDYDIAGKTGNWRIIGFVVSIVTEDVIHDVIYFS